MQIHMLSKNGDQQVQTPKSWSLSYRFCIHMQISLYRGQTAEEPCTALQVKTTKELMEHLSQEEEIEHKENTQ